MLNRRLQDWLTQTGTSRAQLAEQLHVSVRTVESWLGHKNPRPIPRNKVDTIERIIAPKSDPGCIAVQLHFPVEKWERITANLPPGVDPSEAVTQQLMALIDAANINLR